MSDQGVISGLRVVFRYTKGIFYLYLLTLITAALLAWPLGDWLDSNVGDSLMVAEMESGFNYTVFNDFMNMAGNSGISILSSIATWGILLAVLVYCFLSAGIVGTFKIYPMPFKGKEFWHNCAHYFWRFFRAAVFFSLMQIVLLVAFFYLYSWLTNGISPIHLTDDAKITQWLYVLTPFYLIISGFLLCWQDYTKALIVRWDERWVISAMMQAFRIMRKKFRAVMGTFLSYALLFALTMIIFYWVHGLFDIHTNFSIFLSFFLTQILLILRFFIRFGHQASAYLIAKGN